MLVARTKKRELTQVFLGLEGGESFEFRGAEFGCAGGLEKGGAAEAKADAEMGGAALVDSYSGGVLPV